jgi:hypothetical protein
MTVKEMIDILSDMPEDEPVYVPDFNSYDNRPVTNIVLSKQGVLIDY